MLTNPRTPRLVLIGVDYSPASSKAAQLGIEFARRLGASVHLVHAWNAPYSAEMEAPSVPHGDHPNLLEMVRRSAHDAMAAFVASLDTTGVSISTSVESGDPRRVLLRFSETHPCDWVVVGKNTHSSIAEWFLGNVASYVVRHCQVPVLVVPSEVPA
jgi:nucleotide-binding universal stress UspA family protein